MVPHERIDQVLVPVPGHPHPVEPGPYAAAVAAAPRPATAVEAPTPVDGSDTLIAGEVLFPGCSLSSPSKEFAALMRRDGNLVIQRCPDRALVWQAGSGANAGAFLEMRDDGDLCVFALTGARAWSSGTGGEPGAFAQLRDDGVLVVHSFYRQRLWSTELT